MLEQLDASGASREVVVATDCISLPASDTSSFMVYRDVDGAWVVEQSGTVRSCVDREIIGVGGEAWRVHLPPSDRSESSTVRTVDSNSLDIEEAALRFDVSSDEETVRIIVESWRGREQLAPRTYHYMLLTMARARLADRARGVPEAECGWTTVAALADMLKLDVERVNVDICRARKQLALLEVGNAAHLFERRARSGLLRIGVAQLQIARPT
jgi:hypothetical protein